MKPRLYHRIGLGGAVMGFLVLHAPPLAEMLPINRALLALVCALVTILGLIHIFDPRADDPDAE